MDYTIRLRELLEKSVEEACTPEIGIVFSGGIDSTLIAILASRFSKVTAYSCGIPGSPDLEHAMECKNLGFDLTPIELKPEEIEHSMGKIISAIDDTNPVKVSVEVPFYFASKKASEDGLSVMLCGQGSDELFGGYNRYLSSLPDYKKVREMIRNDVENIHTDQLNKDIAVCESNGIELRAPFLDEKFKEYAMEIPIELKIKEVTDSEDFSCIDSVNERRFIRKYILRKLGQQIGVPSLILNRSKKAAQYGSGTWKTLEKIARQRDFKKKAREAGRKDYVGMFLESIGQGSG